MNKLLILLLLLIILAHPVEAMEFTAPEAPDSAAQIMPERAATFGEGVVEILKDVLPTISPNLTSAAKSCVLMLAVGIILSIVKSFPGLSTNAIEITGAILIGTLLLQPAHSLIQLGVDTVMELSEYGKLLLPVMTAAMAAQGGATTSAALYAGTILFDTLLATAITKLIIPLLYLFIALAIANCAIDEDILAKLRDLLKWAVVWVLKIILYVFTGYIAITGVISGSTDAAALKAAKLTISSAVPVVGGILSDASEAVLVGAGVMKNAVGLYGTLAILAVWIQPFIKIGCQYLLLKLTGALCAATGGKRIGGLVQDATTAMGMLLSMTGAVCLMLLISIICFLREVG